ncbi:MAG: hypothetical protein ACREP7_16840 [Lysobacter sp.]
MKCCHLAALLLVMCCALTSCKTVEPANRTLKDLQEWATPEPYHNVSPEPEQQRAKAAMVQWVEQYLKHEYRVIDQRFVLTAPRFTSSAGIGSRAHQYVTQTLGGAMQTDGWLDDDNYMMFLWRFGGSSPRYVAFVVTNDFLPGTRERSLVGYFELMPTAKN